jgi:hypothetical protein
MIRIHWSEPQRHGSADPDPYQNVTDQQHCIKDIFPNETRTTKFGCRPNVLSFVDLAEFCCHFSDSWE